jgi:hypothetical protein
VIDVFLLGLILFCPISKNDNIRKKLIKMWVPSNSLLGKVGKKNPQKESKKMAEKISNVHYMY